MSSNGFKSTGNLILTGIYPKKLKIGQPVTKLHVGFGSINM